MLVIIYQDQLERLLVTAEYCIDFGWTKDISLFLQVKRSAGGLSESPTSTYHQETLSTPTHNSLSDDGRHLPNHLVTALR